MKSAIGCVKGVAATAGTRMAPTICYAEAPPADVGWIIEELTKDEATVLSSQKTLTDLNGLFGDVALGRHKRARCVKAADLEHPRTLTQVRGCVFPPYPTPVV